MLTDVQKIQRRLGIGGSDAAAICGLSKYKTPLQVYYEKVDHGYEVPQNDAMYWGNAHESTVAREYSKRTGKELIFPQQTFIHNDFDFIRGNIDGKIRDENALLECKTTEAYDLSEWGEPGTDEFPTEYILQCAHYSMIAGADYVDLAVLIGLSDFRIYRYTRNEKIESNLLEQEKAFWEEHVLKQIPPEPITLEDVKLRWKTHDENMFIASNVPVDEAIEALKKVREDIKDKEGFKEDLELFIKKYMQHCEGIKNDSGKILATWKTQETNRLDTNLLKIAEPEIFKKYTKKSSSRVFLLKK